MSMWIDVHALWRIVVVGLIVGAGLPALFAVGLRALGTREFDEQPEAGGGSGVAIHNPMGVALATVCFAVVLAAIGWGIYLIVNGT